MATPASRSAAMLPQLRTAIGNGRWDAAQARYLDDAIKLVTARCVGPWGRIARTGARRPRVALGPHEPRS
jgi:hypothetical protein